MNVHRLIQAYNHGLKGEANPEPDCPHCREGWQMGKETKIIREAKAILDDLGRHHSAGWVQIDHDHSDKVTMKKAAQALEQRGMLERRTINNHVRFIERPIYPVNKKAT
jgi:hypothetical protein